MRDMTNPHSPLPLILCRHQNNVHKVESKNSYNSMPIAHHRAESPAFIFAKYCNFFYLYKFHLGKKILAQFQPKVRKHE
jgi:hypothetical protein